MTEPTGAAIIAAKFINQTNRHVFLTGKAGTGKTTFLKHIIKHTHKKAAIVAPTGIAAINAGGTTIHSMFSLPFGSFVPVQKHAKAVPNAQFIDRNSLFRNQHLNKNKKAIIRELELLIIDEVSMLRADVLDAIDAVMRHVRGRSYLPFGGVQVLFIGDMYQLPPVVKDPEWHVLSDFYKSIYFFDSQVLQQEAPIYIELEKIFRQNNPEFIAVLNNLRNNTITKLDTEILNRYYKPGFRQTVNDNHITLTTHNNKAALINKNFLESLTAETFYYEAEIKGEFPDHMFPLDRTLELKKDAQVMFTKNDPSGEQKYFNGKLAKVVGLNSKEIRVEFEDGKELKLDKYTWENKKQILHPVTNEIEDEVLGTFVQYPIKLAWAITVHKSQGLTFDKAIIDVADAFAPGQVYVALSRLRDIKGLILTSPINYTAISGDKKISDFSNVKYQQANVHEQLANETPKFLKMYLNYCYDLTWLHSSVNQHYLEFVEGNKLKDKFSGQIKDLIAATERTRGHAAKFAAELNRIIVSGEADWKDKLLKRTYEAKEYFIPVLKTMSDSLFCLIEQLKEEKKAKQYLAEVVKLEVQYFEQAKKIEKAFGLCQAVINEEEYTRDSYGYMFKNEERSDKIQTAGTSGKQKKKEKGPKKEKIDTKQLTFDLYKEGKTISEIAAARNFAVGTIEGHLAHYIQLKQIKATDLMPAEKVKTIIELFESSDLGTIAQLKTKLGEDYSFGEIKMALASAGYIEDKKRVIVKA
jgi:hypothetical protein